MDKSKRPFRGIKLLGVFLTVAFAGLLLLWLAGLLPQERIWYSIANSKVGYLYDEPVAYVLDREDSAYRLDVFSEALILNHSYYLNTRDNPGSILECPAYRNQGHPVTCLHEIGNDMNLAPNSTRNHYWMGFRAPVRLLLTFFSYQDISQLISVMFWLAFTAAAVCIAQKIGKLAAMVFGLSIAMINPVVVSSMIQYHTCFFLMFLGVCAVLKCERTDKQDICFLVLGQLTQFFDFYTTPLVTWGFPAVAVIAVCYQQKRIAGLRSGVRQMLNTLLCWGAGFFGMLLFKWLLLLCFSDAQDFSAFARLGYYMGLNPSYVGEIEAVGVVEALMSCLKNYISLPLRLVAGFVICGMMIDCIRRRRLQFPDTSMIVFLLVALCPLVWIAIMRQHAMNHAYFEYRILALSAYALGTGVVVSMIKRGKQAKEESKN